MINKIKNELSKVVIGHHDLIDAMLVALFSGGHILIEGPPGVAKTTTVNALTKCFGFEFKRVQFTPDLLPLDIIGNEILDIKSGDFKIKHGAIFTNFLLADELNRAAPKVQSALLEAMAEKQVTIGENSFKLKEPFMVLATQNPYEQEGTYILPEAILDRFMFKVDLSYNNFDEELEIIESVANKKSQKIEQVASKKDYFKTLEQIDSIFIDKPLKEYLLKLVFATREPNSYNLPELQEYIINGASPRASIDLYKASKAFAFINGRDFVTPFDITKSSYLVLAHRLKLSYKAKIDNINQKDIIKTILEKIKVPWKE